MSVNECFQSGLSYFRIRIGKLLLSHDDSFGMQVESRFEIGLRFVCFQIAFDSPGFCSQMRAGIVFLVCQFNRFVSRLVCQF